MGIIREEFTREVSRAERDVMNALKEMSGPRGLPVTHEVPAKWINDVMSAGEVIGTYGIFFTLGHLRSPQFVHGPGYMIHGYIPHKDIASHTIYPDMKFIPEDAENETAWEVMWNEGRGNLRGLEISTNYDVWPMSQWQAVVDNQTGDPVWGNLSAVNQEKNREVE